MHCSVLVSAASGDVASILITHAEAFFSGTQRVKKRTSIEYRQETVEVAAHFFDFPKNSFQAFRISILPQIFTVIICPVRTTWLGLLNQLSVKVSAHSVVDIDDVVICIVHDGSSQLTNAGAR